MKYPYYERKKRFLLDFAKVNLKIIAILSLALWAVYLLLGTQSYSLWQYEQGIITVEELAEQNVLLQMLNYNAGAVYTVVGLTGIAAIAATATIPAILACRRYALAPRRVIGYFDDRGKQP